MFGNAFNTLPVTTMATTAPALSFGSPIASSTSFGSSGFSFGSAVANPVSTTTSLFANKPLFGNTNAASGSLLFGTSTNSPGGPSGGSAFSIANTCSSGGSALFSTPATAASKGFSFFSTPTPSTTSASGGFSLFTTAVSSAAGGISTFGMPVSSATGGISTFGMPASSVAGGATLFGQTVNSTATAMGGAPLFGSMSNTSTGSGFSFAPATSSSGGSLFGSIGNSTAQGGTATGVMSTAPSTVAPFSGFSFGKPSAISGQSQPSLFNSVPSAGLPVTATTAVQPGAAPLLFGSGTTVTTQASANLFGNVFANQPNLANPGSGGNQQSNTGALATAFAPSTSVPGLFGTDCTEASKQITSLFTSSSETAPSTQQPTSVTFPGFSFNVTSGGIAAGIPVASGVFSGTTTTSSLATAGSNTLFSTAPSTQSAGMFGNLSGQTPSLFGAVSSANVQPGFLPGNIALTSASQFGLSTSAPAKQPSIVDTTTNISFGHNSSSVRAPAPSATLGIASDVQQGSQVSAVGQLPAVGLNTIPAIAGTSVSASSAPFVPGGTTPIFGSTLAQTTSALVTTTTAPFGLSSSASQVVASAPMSSVIPSLFPSAPVLSKVPLGGIGASTTVPSSETVAISVDKPIKFGDLEQIINRLAMEIQANEHSFMDQMMELNAYDLIIRKNEAEIMSMAVDVNDLVEQSQQFFHTIDSLSQQQMEMESSLTSMEKSLGLEEWTENRPIELPDPVMATRADIQRQALLRLQLHVDAQLKQINIDVNDLSEQIEEQMKLSERDKNDDSVETIAQILQRHLALIEWIDKESSELSTQAAKALGKIS